MVGSTLFCLRRGHKFVCDATTVVISLVLRYILLVTVSSSFSFKII